MKKLYLSLALSAILGATFPANATNIQDAQAQLEHKLATTQPLARIKLPSPSQVFPVTSRSGEQPATDLNADRMEFWYYGDLLGNGTNVYYLFLSNMEMFKGNPTAEGQMLRILLIAGEDQNPESPTLPAGTFTCTTDETPETLVAGTFFAEDSNYLDVFYNPDNPASKELYAYNFNITAGSLSISKDNDSMYDINAVLNGEIVNNNDEVIYESPINASYKGESHYFDHNAYTPLGADMNVENVSLSGRVSTGGGWSLAFYNLPLDEDGFIIGAGELMNVELYTEDAEKFTASQLIGEYTGLDMFNSQPSEWPGHFVQGVWYDFYGTYMAIGTNLSTYNDMGDVVLTGLAESGTIKVTGTNDPDVLNVDINVTTKEGNKVTCNWQGRVPDFVEGCEATAGINDIMDNDNTPVKYYNLQGVMIDTPEPGSVVIRVQGSKAQKIIAK